MEKVNQNTSKVTLAKDNFIFIIKVMLNSTIIKNGIIIEKKFI
tara:strand:- start:1363 stop:1491 length:129 start_codon:yes stop_codon:yes gene_type:complete